MAEHDRLELQHGIQQPEAGQGELQLPARVKGRRTLVSSSRARDGVADREALAPLPVPPISIRKTKRTLLDDVQAGKELRRLPRSRKPGPGIQETLLGY